MAAISSEENPQQSHARLADTVSGSLKIRELNIFSSLIKFGILINTFSLYFTIPNELMGVFRSFSLIAIMSVGMITRHYHRRYRLVDRFSDALISIRYRAGASTGRRSNPGGKTWGVLTDF
ncbi:hypothetical protein [Caballeronia sp. SBC2]|uniref:hypothetical protein n=1 Tax=Caballeronia sp. SBC2 TaxID=2705547 RepID=UPI0013E0FD8F|nr:hypothetical protein [Caballeronia sp. SBC2]QIE29536.1 hypothetical protein SBC2_76120 [Caballeronia sp. SBC2]